MEEVFLPSEELEALPSVSMVGMPFLPPPPAQPTFGPQSQPYGFSQSSLVAPPPPHSLAPVAMGSDRSYGGVSATGTNPQQIPAPRDKPSFKWGIMIALSGAVVGAVLGLGWDAGKHHAPTASVSVPSMKVAANSVAAPSDSPVANALAAAAAPPPAVMPVVAPATDNAAPPGVIAPPAPPPTKAEKRAAAKAAAAAAAAERAEKAAADKADRAAAAPPKRSTMMAAKVTAPPPAPKAPPPVVEKAPPPPPPAPAKLTKAEKAAAAAAEKAEKKTGTPEAQKALEDAIKDTTNTL